MRFNFLAFLGSTFASGVSGTIVRVAVAWLLLSRSQSPLWLSGLAGLTMFLSICSKPFLAAFTDIFGARRIYVVSTALGLPFVALLALAPYSGDWILLVAAAALIPMTALSALRDSAAPVLSVSLLEASDVARGQMLRTASIAMVSILGPLLAGVLVEGQAAYVAFASATLLVVVCMALSMRIRDNTPNTRPADVRKALHPAQLVRSAFDCVRCVWQNHSERGVALASGLMNSAMSALMLILLPSVINLKFHGTPTDLAVAETGLGIGLLAGSLLLTRVANRLLGSHLTTFLGAMMPVASFVAATFIDSVWVLACAQALAGIGMNAFMVNTSTMRGIATPEAFRSRTINGAGFLSLLPSPLFALVVGALAARAGLEVALGVTALLCVAAAAVMASNVTYRKLSSLSAEALKGAYGPLYPIVYGVKQHV